MDYLYDQITGPEGATHFRDLEHHSRTCLLIHIMSLQFHGSQMIGFNVVSSPNFEVFKLRRPNKTTSCKCPNFLHFPVLKFGADSHWDAFPSLLKASSCTYSTPHSWKPVTVRPSANLIAKVIKPNVFIPSLLGNVPS